MRTTADIVEYIQLRLDLAHIVYQSIVPDIQDKDGNFYPNSLAIDDHLVMENVEKVAYALGTTAENLMKCKRLNLWEQKFSYFELLPDLKQNNDIAIHASGYGEQRLMQAIFGNDEGYAEAPYPFRYDTEDITFRLLLLLTEYQKVMPYAMPEGAKLQNVKVHMNCIYHYKKIDVLCDALFELLDRAEQLFFEGLQDELPIAEQQEYNFIVSALGIHDVVMPSSELLYYPVLHQRRTLYLQEGGSTLADYICTDRIPLQQIMRCAEFLDNPDLLQRFLPYYPYIKRDARINLMPIKNFLCDYEWVYPDGHIDTNQSLYVPKTEAELGEDVKYLEILDYIMKPENTGGMSVPILKKIDIPRMQARVALRKGGSAR